MALLTLVIDPRTSDSTSRVSPVWGIAQFRGHQRGERILRSPFVFVLRTREASPRSCLKTEPSNVLAHPANAFQHPGDRRRVRQPEPGEPQHGALRVPHPAHRARRRGAGRHHARRADQRRRAGEGRAPHPVHHPPAAGEDARRTRSGPAGPSVSPTPAPVKAGLHKEAAHSERLYGRSPDVVTGRRGGARRRAPSPVSFTP